MEKLKLNIQLFAVTKSTTFSEPALTTAMITANKSTLNIRIRFSANNSVTYFSSATLSCTCNGVTQSASVTHSRGGSVDKTFTFANIPHNNDGTKKVSWSWSCATGTSVLGTVSDSGIRTLQTIPRASTPSFNPNPVDLGQAVTISLDKKITNSRDVLTFSVSGASGTIGETTGNSYIWTPSLDLADIITNSGTASCNITCTSYNGTTKIGSVTKTLTLNVPSSIVPTVTVGTITEANAEMVELAWNVFVQNKSQLSIPITVTPSASETISRVYIAFTEWPENYEGTLTVNPDTGVVTTNITTNIVPISGTLNGTVNVLDSRGRTTTQTITVSLSSYAPPVITSYAVKRVNASNVDDDSGTFLNYTFVASVSNIGGNVSATTFKVRYKRKNDNSYSDIASATFTNVASISKTNQRISTPEFSTDYSFDIQFYIEDAFNEVKVYTEIDSEGALVDYNDSGTAMAIGKVSEAGANERLLEINLPTEFYEDIEAPKGEFDQLFIGAINLYNTSAINDPNLVLDSSIINIITPLAGSNFAAAGGSYYYKIGTKVYVHLAISGLNNDIVQIYELPAGYRPYGNIYNYGLSGTMLNFCSVEITSQGIVSVRPTGRYAFCFVVFDAFN